MKENAKKATFLFPDPLKPLLKGLLEAEIPLYAVGGMVRDQLLKRESKDLDLLVMAPNAAPKLLERAQAIGLKSFPLDQERGIFRGIYKGWIVDFTEPRAPTLDDDLFERDFTINALAVHITRNSIEHGGQVFDPTGGLGDLHRRRLRTARRRNIQDDPLRALRCYRFALVLGFQIEEETQELVEEGLCNLNRIAGERIAEELSTIFSHPLSHTLWTSMARRGTLPLVFPLLEQCQGDLTGKWYGCDLLFHQVGVLKGTETVLASLPLLVPAHWRDLRVLLTTRVEGGWTQGSLLKLAALLHDIGKPMCRRREGDKVVFWGHDRSGEALLDELIEQLKLGRAASSALKTHVREHMRMHLLARPGEISPKAKGRYLRDLGDSAPLTPLLSLADAWASSGDVGLFNLLPFVEEMVSFYYNNYLQQGEPIKPLLNGHRVMEILGIEPGPKVGQVLEMLIDAQLEGAITTPEEAEEWLRGLREEANV